MRTNARQGSLTAIGWRERSASNPIIALLSRSVNSNDPFRNYQTRAILCIAAIATLFCLPTLAIDLMYGNLELVLVTGLGGVSMICAIGALVLFGRMELASHIVLLTLFAMMVALLVTRQGVTLGFYVGVTALVFLSSFLASRPVAISYAIACVALLAAAAWLSHTQWQSVIELSDPVVATGALRIALIVLVFNLVSMMLLRDSTREMYDELQAKKTEACRLNAELSQALNEKQAWLRTLARIQVDGHAIAWRYESRTGVLRYISSSAATDGDTLLQSIHENDRDALDAQSWQAKILETIASAGERTQSWLREIHCVDSVTGKSRSYKVSAETELAANGGIQIVGLIREVSTGAGSNALQA